MISASRNRGMVMPRNENTTAARRPSEYCRVAARMPKLTPITIANRWQVSAMPMVAGSRRHTTSEIGLL